jgi:hypothetical protein
MIDQLDWITWPKHGIENPSDQNMWPKTESASQKLRLTKLTEQHKILNFHSDWMQLSLNRWSTLWEWI